MIRTVGVDLDNTIVSYDALLRDEAARRGLVGKDEAGSKKEIRDRIRRLPGGEIEWQRLQACIYGPRMHEAELIQGVRGFFERARQECWRCYVISHKTKVANYDETGTNLREAALAWMRLQGFFGEEGPGLAEEDVLFGETRVEKIAHIRAVGCTDFIDDLEEVFQEPGFPSTVNQVLYAPHGEHGQLDGVRVARSWDEIHECFFGRNG